MESVEKGERGEGECRGERLRQYLSGINGWDTRTSNLSISAENRRKMSVDLNGFQNNVNVIINSRDM